MNGQRLESLQYNAAIGTGEGYTGGGTYSIVVPLPHGRDTLRFETTWIDWTSGEAWSATMDLIHPDLDSLRTISIFYQPGGALSAWVAGPAMMAGTLDRRATREDYVRIAAACATPVDPQSALYAELSALRDQNYGVDTAWLAARPKEDPGPNTCAA